jgi:hypothetical protein
MSRWTCGDCDERTDEAYATCHRCQVPRPTGSGWPAGRTLLLLYPGNEQVDASARYLAHAEALEAAGYLPIATSWGQTPPGAGSAFFFGNLEEAYRVGTLLVTYRQEAGT